uniref:Homeobox protein prospero n=1 Tax=Syphacia muris TaxID=451379 RepID=A0A0N5AQV9_9BILA
MDIEKPIRPETLLKRYRNFEMEHNSSNSNLVKVSVLDTTEVNEINNKTDSELLLKPVSAKVSGANSILQNNGTNNTSNKHNNNNNNSKNAISDRNKRKNDDDDVDNDNNNNADNDDAIGDDNEENEDDDNEGREHGATHLSPSATESDAGQFAGDDDEECHDLSPEEKRPRIERPRAQYASSVRRTSAPACLWSATSLFSDQPTTSATASTLSSFQDNLTLLQKLLAKQKMKCSPSASSSPDSGLGHELDVSSSTIPATASPNDVNSQAFTAATAAAAAAAVPFAVWPWLTDLIQVST